MNMAKMYEIEYLLNKHCGYLQLLPSVTQGGLRAIRKGTEKGNSNDYKQTLSLGSSTWRSKGDPDFS